MIFSIRALHKETTSPQPLIRPRLPLHRLATRHRLTVLSPSSRISARARQRTVAATGTAPPAVDYDVGSGRAPRPSARRFITPARVSRPQPSLAVVLGPAPAPSPVPTPTAPITSDRNRTESAGIPLLPLPPLTDEASVTTTDLNVVGRSCRIQLRWFRSALFAR